MRMFARSALNSQSPVIEFFSNDDLEDRGGVGDELDYNEFTDTFTSWDMRGHHANPTPGNPLTGAAILIPELEAQDA